MAIKVENFTSFTVNGKTFEGAFPVFSSEITCATDEAVSSEDQLKQDLEAISEN